MNGANTASDIPLELAGVSSNEEEPGPQRRLLAAPRARVIAARR